MLMPSMKDYFSKISPEYCKGHVTYSHTYEEMDYTYYLEKAKKWLNTEEYDFRTRSLVSKSYAKRYL